MHNTLCSNPTVSLIVLSQTSTAFSFLNIISLSVFQHQFNYFLTNHEQNNIENSKLYRKYNEELPKLMQDRPHQMIDDVRCKMAKVDWEALSDGV